MPTKHHSELIRRGLRWHERRHYGRALPFFVEALEQWPSCPNARYNLANTLHMLDRDEEACAILRELIDSSDRELLDGCDDLAGSPRSLRLDAHFLLFLSTLHAEGEWRKAVPHLRRHLRSRARGVRSLWTKSEALRRAEELRLTYAPGAQRVAP
jgi:tetratricopeptide (TPR) repeat protein